MYGHSVPESRSPQDRAVGARRSDRFIAGHDAGERDLRTRGGGTDLLAERCGPIAHILYKPGGALFQLDTRFAWGLRLHNGGASHGEQGQCRAEEQTAEQTIEETPNGTSASSAAQLRLQARQVAS
jgi:hypothetical protein